MHKFKIFIPPDWFKLWLIILGLSLIQTTQAVTFKGCIFFDQNGNNTYEIGEPVRANVSVYFIDKGGHSAPITGEDGCYSFISNHTGDFTIWIDIPTNMRQVTPVAGEVGQPAFYDLPVTNVNQTVRVNFGLVGETPTEIWSMRDDGVMVSNSEYDMLVKPNKDATEKTTMQINQVGDVYQGDNQASQVYVAPNNNRSASRSGGADEFSILVGKNVSDTGEEVALNAQTNSDGSVSFMDPQSPTVIVTAHSDGNYTGVDSSSPNVNVTFDQTGHITATDSDDTMSLLIDKTSGETTITDSEYPTTKATINLDGSYIITDEEFSNLIATVYANNEYVVQDLENNMIVHIDSQGNYMVVDNESGMCVVLPNTRGFLSKLWKGVKKVFNTVTRFVSKVAGFVAKVARFVVKVARVISVVARVVATIAKVAAVLFPPLCPLFCAIASFAEGVATISDVVGNFASRVADIAEAIQNGGGIWVGSYAGCNDTKRGVRGETDGPVLEGSVSETVPSDIVGDIGKIINFVKCQFFPPKEPPKQEIGIIFKGNGGQVSDISAEIDCKAVESPCLFKQVVGTVMLIARGENFIGWGGACSGYETSRTCVLVADNTSKEVEAEFGIRLPLAKNEIRGYESEIYQPGDNIFGYVRIGCIKEDVSSKNCLEYGPKLHSGWDLRANTGTNVYAIADGKVEYIRSNTSPCQGYGNCISISFNLNGTNYFAFYAHLDTINVNEGKVVIKGNKIGTTGRTGNASKLPADGSEDHLHFEIRDQPYHPINPVLIYGSIPPDEPEKKTKSASRSSETETYPNNCLSPPFTVLDYLTASHTPQSNRLTWATLAEFGNNGFNVYRAEKNAAGELINQTKVNANLVPAQEGAQWGATYNFEDTGTIPGKTYFYMIEDVDSDGVNTLQEEFIAEVKSNELLPAACLLYGVQDQALNDSIFFSYSPHEKSVNPLGETCKGCDIEALAIHPVTREIYLGSGDNAFGHPKGHLYQLDAQSGELRSVGNTGFKDISGLAFDQQGTLWAWAKGQGLVTLNLDTGEGELVLATPVELADLTWDETSQVLYGVIGQELWRYMPADGSVAKVCGGLPPKTEAVKVLPSSVLPEGLVLLGSHNNQKLELQAFEIATCQLRQAFNFTIGYDDVEGFAMPMAACQ